MVARYRSAYPESGKCFQSEGDRRPVDTRREIDRGLKRGADVDIALSAALFTLDRLAERLDAGVDEAQPERERFFDRADSLLE